MLVSETLKDCFKIHNSQYSFSHSTLQFSKIAILRRMSEFIEIQRHIAQFPTHFLKPIIF